MVRPTTPADSTDATHVKEYWSMISDDIKHDGYFVHHCWVHVIMPHLHALDCNVRAIYQRTDNCATQYKSRYTMIDISNALEEIGVEEF